MDLLYDLADLVYRFMQSAPPLPLDLLCLAVAGIPATLLHELAHAYAARRLLGADVEVSVGSAVKVAQVRLGKITATVNALSHPGTAAGFAAFDDSRARATDIIWIALAGPLASLAVGLVSALLFSTVPATGPLHDLLWASVIVGIAGTLTLIPFAYQERRDGPQLRSDGRLVLDALKVARAIR